MGPINKSGLTIIMLSVMHSLHISIYAFIPGHVWSMRSWAAGVVCYQCLQRSECKCVLCVVCRNTSNLLWWWFQWLCEHTQQHCPFSRKKC